MQVLNCHPISYFRCIVYVHFLCTYTQYMHNAFNVSISLLVCISAYVCWSPSTESVEIQSKLMQYKPNFIGCRTFSGGVMAFLSGLNCKEVIPKDSIVAPTRKVFARSFFYASMSEVFFHYRFHLQLIRVK